eukprot:gene33345-40336_t
MSVDTLSPFSRDFYERSLNKTTLAIFSFGLSLFYLGMVAYAGGLSQAYLLTQDNVDDDTTLEGLEAFSAGYGFGAFFFFCSFVIALAAGIYVLPAATGSEKEAKSLKSPTILEQA